MKIESIANPLMWAGFLILVLILLAVDLGVFHRREHAVRPREALLWTMVWVGVSLAFNAGVYFWFGPRHGLEFLTGYVLEKALSVDNLFVFLVLFSYFAVPAKLQHRVLFWGILGALLMRALFVFAGTALIQTFHGIIYVFGAFLVFTGFRLLFQREGEQHPERNPVLRIFRRLVPSVPDYRGPRFLVQEGGRWLATPLLAVVVAIEATDIVFAVDSIPAVFAITTDPFIVYTSNIFAILGLRSLYFLLAGMLGGFRFLKVGLGLVLAFVGAKMLLSGMVEIPILLSLAVIAGLLATSVLASVVFPERGAPPEDGDVR